MQTKAIMVVDGDLEDIFPEWPGESEHRSHGHLVYFVLSHLKNKYPLAYTPLRKLTRTKQTAAKQQRQELARYAAKILEFIQDQRGSEWGRLVLDAIAEHDWRTVDKILVGVTALNALATTC